jgi:hypothetical protein
MLERLGLQRNGDLMRRRLRALILAAGGIAGAVLLASPAFAGVSWGPLTSSYNGITRSSSHGTFDNVGGVYASVHAWLNDTSNDGNNVYTNADFYFYEYYPESCGNAGSCFVEDYSAQSKEYTYSNTPTTFYLQRPLHDQASQARASIYTCVQLGWPVPDHCSSRAIATFSY